MVDIIFPVVQIFINAYNAVNEWLVVLFQIDENSFLYKLADVADTVIGFLPDILENGIIGDMLHGLVQLGTQPLIATIFGTTLIVCICWSIVKFLLPT